MSIDNDPERKRDRETARTRRRAYVAVGVSISLVVVFGVLGWHGLGSSLAIVGLAVIAAIVFDLGTEMIARRR
jgi:hypothetical protein